VKVKLTHFQSIKKGEVNISGLVGIVGQNNVGKTAIMRAVRDFVMNTFGAEKIQQGEDSGTIEIDGIRLIRKEKTSTLVMPDGKKFEKMAGAKTARTIELKDFLLIDNTKISNALPQFVFQRETPFPFSLSAAQIYYIFSMLFDIEKLQKIFIYTKDKIKHNTDDIKYNKGKLDEVFKMKSNLEEKRQNLPPMAKIADLERRFDGLSLFLERSNTHSAKTTQLKQVQALYKLKSAQLYIYLSQLKKKYQDTRFDVSNFAVLDLLEKLSRKKVLTEKIRTMTGKLDDLETCAQLYLKYAAVKGFLEKIEQKKLLMKNIRMTFEKQLELTKGLESFTICPLCERAL
jgi:AAA15 family ATPase/GTPase